MSSKKTQESTSSLWNLYGYWEEPSTTSKIKESCNSVTETTHLAQQILRNPAPFFEAVTSGVMKGISDKDSPEGSLFDKISHITTNGVSKVSAAALETLLKNSETYDLDDKDKDLKNEALQALKAAREEKKSLKETAKAVWTRLDQYHLLLGGVNLNLKTSSNECVKKMREGIDSKNNDGVSPIHSLVHCQEKWGALRVKYNLNVCSASETLHYDPTLLNRKLSKDEIQELQILKTKTNKMADVFANKTCHFATMQTIHHLFNHPTDPFDCKKFLERNDNIKARYLGQFQTGSLRYYLYKLTYTLLFWLIRPMIAPTIKNAITQIRDFLGNEVDLLKFVEQKVRDMKSYYGRIERGRRKYLGDDSKSEAGTFEEFLEESIRVYGGKYTEEQLIKIFQEYVVQNLVSRPVIECCGYRIPLISSLLEWAVHAIRKAIVREVLNQTGIIEKMLTQGSGSIHYAQLGLKRLLEQKLTQIVEMIDRSRSLVTSTIDHEAKIGLEAKKAEIISRRLHLAIQEHSQKLLRFIDIEHCNGNENKLRRLDNRVSELISEVLGAIGNIVKRDLFSLEKVLEDASTDVLETSLISLFENKEFQTETQLQTIFGILERNFTYIPNAKKAEMEHRFREECALVDDNLNALQEQLARSAVATTLEKHLKNVSGERHNAIKKYVTNEQDKLQQFTDELSKQFEILTKITSDALENPNDRLGKTLKEQLSSTVVLIENYLRYISTQLRSPNLEGCYSDVKGDLHNIYAIAISALSQINKTMETIAARNEEIQECEQEVMSAEKIEYSLHNLVQDRSFKNVQNSLAEMTELIPKSLKDTTAPIMQDLKNAWKQLQETSATRSEYRKYLSIQHFIDTEKKLDTLANVTGHLNRSNTFPIGQHNTAEKKNALNQQFTTLLDKILKSRDPNIKKYVLPLLKGSTPDELYKVFYASFFRSQVPIFSQMRNIKSFYQKEWEKLSEKFKKNEQKNSLQKTLEESQRQAETKIQALTEELCRLLKDNSSHKIHQIHSTHKSVGTVMKDEITKSLDGMRLIINQFKVEGCISVGELKLYNNLAPELTSRISPEIIKGTRTLIDALGKPFHYKQLTLRLLFLDIARRHEIN